MEDRNISCYILFRSIKKVVIPGLNSMRILLFFSSIFLAILGSASCSVDHGLSPHLGKITGKIIFLNRDEDYIKKTDEIRVAVAKTFPPTEFTELITSSPLPKRAGDTLSYELIVPFGTYEILGVVWKAREKPWNISDVMGYYRSGLDLLPSSITVTENEPVAESVDVVADFRLVIREARISGTIYYEGEWPANTEIIGLGAYRNVPDPNNIFSILTASSAKIGLPAFVPSYEYTLPVGVGRFEYIGLFWKAKNAPFTEIKVLGFHADQDFPDRPGAVTLEQDETLNNIDIHVDFNSLDL
jgi:hypothetical protein